MPSRKQRRRRDKTFRHEYDLVVYDEEGNEVAVDTAELRAKKQKDAPKAKKGQKGARPKRTPRVVAPATWERALKRGGVMGVILLAAMVLIHGPIILGVIYGIALIPFTYFIDRTAYRNYVRRSGKP